MKRVHFGVTAIFLVLAALLSIAVTVYVDRTREDQKHYERGETDLRVSNLSRATLTLLKAGRTSPDAMRVREFHSGNLWLEAGNYFLEVEEAGRISYIPIPLTGYRCGPDEDGSFVATIRSVPKEFPPRLHDSLPEFVFIPSGDFLLGDRTNPREQHYVWLTGFFVAPFEVTNGEFRQFLSAPDGYTSDANWTELGRAWRATGTAHSSALLTPASPDYSRFGLNDQPITWVTWFEANAFCRWMTRTIGGKKWQYSLPNDAEWEKFARGPDNLDYGLSMTISDPEVQLYNWRKNPDAPFTVCGIHATLGLYQPNRYGVYHVTGNVVEWTQSISRPFSSIQPFTDDERNHDETLGLRTARGGSWYSAATSYLYIPYRDSFQPEHSSQDIGFRIVARALP